MKIKMNVDANGSYDGIHVQRYEKDQMYDTGNPDMSEDLAKLFLEDGRASLIPDVKLNGPSEVKDDGKKTK